ncbi:hypothetical protein [Pseudomonas amygdali]|uniref:hypothetical protein n=1 Tax=Pseudomonas amygdali TaxID=47877 RepID=UPI000EFF0E5F|nr:hypothetical protein [Pseudomonas amygdali]
MSVKEEFKILRSEFSKKPEIKTVPEFIIEGLTKLGYRTDDLQTPKPDGTATIRGNEYLVFGAGESYNKLVESYLQVSTILKHEAKLSKLASEWVYGLDHISDHEIVAKRIFQEAGLHMDFSDFKKDYVNDKFLFNHLDGENKKAAQHILENANDSYIVPAKMTFDMNHSIFVANTLSAIEKDKPKRKIKP